LKKQNFSSIIHEFGRFSDDKSEYKEKYSSPINVNELWQIIDFNLEY
jgi:hypothetical protein